MLFNWDKIKKIAVIGASRNKNKYGYKIVEKLIAKGYKLFSINKKAGKILGEKVYLDISEVIKEIDLIVLVVPPVIALEELKKIMLLKPDAKVIVQPGAESEKLISYVKNNGYEKQVYYNTCVMVVSADKNN